MPQLTGDDVVRLAKEIEKGRRFLAQSRTYLYVVSHLYAILLSNLSVHLLLLDISQRSSYCSYV